MLEMVLTFMANVGLTLTTRRADAVKQWWPLGTNVARLALAWCIKNPNMSTAIMGASKVSQLEDNLKSVDVVDQLTEEVMEKIEGILDNKPEAMAFQA